MDLINSDLKQYIENEILSIYEKYDQFKREIHELLEDNDKFSKKYIEVNQIFNIK